MAGSIKESKKQTGFYFEDDEKDVLKIGSDRSGMNMSDWVKYLTHKAAFDTGLIPVERYTSVILRLKSMPLAMREKTIREAHERRPSTQHQGETK